jgi:hypothetical protein
LTDYAIFFSKYPLKKKGGLLWFKAEKVVPKKPE